MEHLARTAAALFEAHGYAAVTMEQLPSLGRSFMGQRHPARRPGRRGFWRR